MRVVSNRRGAANTSSRLARAAVIAVGAGIGLGVSAAQAISLEDAVRLTVTTSPRIGIVASNREQIDEELRQARGIYLPTVDLALGIGGEVTDNRETRAAGETDRVLTREEASLNVVQRLFDGFETDSRVAREKARIQSAARRVYENSEFIALDAIGAYLEVRRQRELVALAEQNIQVHLDILDSLQQRLAAGAGSSADVSQTQARVARSRATRAQTANDLRDAEALYARIVGQFPDEIERPTLPVDALPQSLDAALEMARRSNPTVKIFEADVDSAEAEVSLAQSAFYPLLTIEAQSNYTNDAGGINAYDWENRIMLRMRWNLFRGGIDRAARQEALAVVAENKNRRFNAFLEANEEVRRSWAAFEASQTRVRNLGEAVGHNVDTRNAYKQQFTVAQRTLLDVLDAENELFVSRGQLATAEINELRAGYRLLAVDGVLLTTLGIPAPEQASEVSESFSQSILLR